MNFECSYNNIALCGKSVFTSDDCICDGNLIVPDFMSDISDILSVKAYPAVSDTKSEQGRISVKGVVRFNVLYIGEDNKTSVCSLSVSVPFSHMISALGVTGEHVAMARVLCCSASHTLVNSRRLKVCATVRFCADAYLTSRVRALSSADGAQTQTCLTSLPSAKVIAKKTVVTSQTVDIPSGKDAVKTILRAEASVSDSNFKCLNNKLITKGNLLVSVLYLSDSSPTDFSLTIPFTEVVEAEGLSPDCETFVNLTVADWDIKPDTDLSGDYKMLDCSVILSVEIISFCTETHTTVSDIFLPGGKLKTECAQIDYSDLLPTLCEEEFVKDVLTLPAETSPVSRIIDADCTLTDFSLSDSTLTATASTTLIFVTGDGSDKICSHTFSMPLTHRFNLNHISSAGASLKHIGYAITGSNTVEMRMCVNFSASDTPQHTLNVFTDCDSVDYTPPTRPSIVVCVVNEGESLWDIAKKYNISLSSLAVANALDETASCTKGTKLIIPR